MSSAGQRPQRATIAASEKKDKIDESKWIEPTWPPRRRGTLDWICMHYMRCQTEGRNKGDVPVTMSRQVDNVEHDGAFRERLADHNGRLCCPSRSTTGHLTRSCKVWYCQLEGTVARGRWITTYADNTVYVGGEEES